VSEKLSHFDEAGQARMVDVGAKAATRREAVAGAFVELNEAVLAALPKNPKGNPLEVARFAGIQAAKKTSELIPMCHPLALSFVDVQATVVAGRRGDSRDCSDRRRNRCGDGGDDRGGGGRADRL
jgi:cyclic pyranopterin phosphate synthase